MLDYIAVRLAQAFLLCALFLGLIDLVYYCLDLLR